MRKSIKCLRDYFLKNKNKRGVKELIPYQNMVRPILQIREVVSLLQADTVLLGWVDRGGCEYEVFMNSEEGFDFEFYERDALVSIFYHFRDTLGFKTGPAVVRLNEDAGFSANKYVIWMDGYNMQRYFNRPERQGV